MEHVDTIATGRLRLEVRTESMITGEAGEEWELKTLISEEIISEENIMHPVGFEPTLFGHKP